MYRVIWQPSATDDLAELCLNQQHQWPEMDAAERDVDYKLRMNPYRFSQRVAEGLRRIVSNPLVIYCR